MQRLILGMLGFGVVALFLTGTPMGTVRGYLLLLGGLAAIILVAMRVGASGHYRAGAALTVAASLAPPWCSLLLDPEVLRGDYIPLAYSVLPMILAAILLGVGAVVLVSAVQAVGFVVLLALAPPSSFNWPSLLSLILVVAVLACIAGLMAQADVRATEEANRRLRELQELLRQEASHDPLTGLYNRRHLDEQLAGEIARAERSGTTFGVLLVDVDNFKAVNDQAGHDAGDEVLVCVADLMVRQSRHNDITCRMGGDEFLLILGEADAEGSRVRAERLRADVQAANRDRTGPPITLSVGVASHPAHGATAEALLKSADVALYAAKEGGRNRVEMAVLAVPDALPEVFPGVAPVEP